MNFFFSSLVFKWNFLHFSALHLLFSSTQYQELKSATDTISQKVNICRDFHFEKKTCER